MRTGSHFGGAYKENDRHKIVETPLGSDSM